MNIIIVTVLAVALALIVAAFCGWAYRVGYEAGRQVDHWDYQTGYDDGLEAGRTERAAEHYARGHQDATDEINARRNREEREAFARGYQRCMRDHGIEDGNVIEGEVVEYRPAKQLASVA